GGYDLADGDGDFSDANMHGTHVAGIIGGKGSKDYLKGMAYEANFMIYKVFSRKYQGASEGNVLSAIDRATADRCKVINLSLGSPGETRSKSSSAYHNAVSNATKAGVVVVAAAGNDGARGKIQPWPSHAPGILEDSICVASTDDRDFQILKVTFPKQNSRLITGMKGPFTPPFDKSLNGLPLVNCGYGSDADFRKIDVKGKIAIVMRGPKEGRSINLREKVDNAMGAGAKAIIIYNHTPAELIAPVIYGNNEDPNSVQLIPTVFITKEDGELLLSLIDNNLKLEFEDGGGVSISDFSSMGPTVDACFKPEISAPGSSIFSTVPGGYGIASGTSMASPMIAGLAALIREVHPDWKTMEVKSALMNTATITKNPYNGKPITFLLQGAGEADVLKALNTPALIEPRAIVIEKSNNTKQDFTVKNITANNINFSLSYELFLDKGEASPVSIELSTNSLSLSTGSSGRFTVNFNIDKTKFERSRVEGIIKLNELHIPFIIYKDSVVKIEDQVSNIKITPNELYFTEDKHTDDIEISFSLNYGNTIKSNDLNLNYNSNYGSTNIKIIDATGEEWSTIASLSNLLVGDYKVHWSAKDSDNKYILPEGKYYLEFNTAKIDLDSGTTEPITLIANQQIINVKESIVPEPIPLIISAYKIIAPKQEFNFDIYLPKAEEVRGITFSLQYSADKLTLKRVLEGYSLNSDGSKVEISADIDDSKGLANITALRDFEKGVNSDKAKMLSIVFKSIESGTLKFKLNSCYILLENNGKVKAQPIYPKVKVNKNGDFLLSDLNNDKIVDQYDLIEFSKAYGSKLGDGEFNDNCDFNQDQSIDILDLITLSNEFGKTI
ncbi:MAG: S8 family serine peptidase, partial [Candidatus Syntrophosphaera sp.]|nr:S8 family serine peptidase [Candidatus Syntrophosphaera sp.]